MLALAGEVGVLETGERLVQPRPHEAAAGVGAGGAGAGVLLVRGVRFLVAAVQIVGHGLPADGDTGRADAARPVVEPTTALAALPGGTQYVQVT